MARPRGHAKAGRIAVRQSGGFEQRDGLAHADVVDRSNPPPRELRAHRVVHRCPLQRRDAAVRHVADSLAPERRTWGTPSRPTGSRSRRGTPRLASRPDGASWSASSASAWGTLSWEIDEGDRPLTGPVVSSAPEHRVSFSVVVFPFPAQDFTNTNVEGDVTQIAVIGGAVAAGNTPVAVVANTSQGATAGGVDPLPQPSSPPRERSGRESRRPRARRSPHRERSGQGNTPAPQTILTSQGATGQGVSPTATGTAIFTIQGALAGGAGPGASAPPPQGGCTGNGTGPIAVVTLTSQGATAGGVSPVATGLAIFTIQGALAQGNGPGATVPPDPGGTNGTGSGPTAVVVLTSQGATAGGPAPTESTGVADTPAPGGGTAGGTGPLAIVATTAQGATAGGTAPTAYHDSHVPGRARRGRRRDRLLEPHPRRRHGGRRDDPPDRRRHRSGRTRDRQRTDRRRHPLPWWRYRWRYRTRRVLLRDAHARGSGRGRECAERERDHLARGRARGRPGRERDLDSHFRWIDRGGYRPDRLRHLHLPGRDRGRQRSERIQLGDREPRGSHCGRSRAERLRHRRPRWRARGRQRAQRSPSGERHSGRSHRWGSIPIRGRCRGQGGTVTSFGSTTAYVNLTPGVAIGAGNAPTEIGVTPPTPAGPTPGSGTAKRVRVLHNRIEILDDVRDEDEEEALLLLGLSLE